MGILEAVCGGALIASLPIGLIYLIMDTVSWGIEEWRDRRVGK